VADGVCVEVGRDVCVEVGAGVWVEVGEGMRVAVGLFASEVGVALDVRVRMGVGGEVAISIPGGGSAEIARDRTADIPVKASTKTPARTKRNKASKVLLFIN